METGLRLGLNDNQVTILILVEGSLQSPSTVIAPSTVIVTILILVEGSLQ